MALDTQLTQSVAKDLLDLDSDQLYEMLGIKVKEIQEDVSKQGIIELKVQYDEHMGAMDEFRKIGRRMFNKLHIQAYQLVCGEDSEDESDRNKFMAALGISSEAAVIVLTSTLIGTFGLAAALAAVVAALIVKRFAEPTLKEGHNAMCELWKENLPDS